MLYRALNGSRLLADIFGAWDFINCKLSGAHGKRRDLRSISPGTSRPDVENSTERFITYAVYLRETGGNSEAWRVHITRLYHICEIAVVIAIKCDGTVLTDILYHAGMIVGTEMRKYLDRQKLSSSTPIPPQLLHVTRIMVFLQYTLLSADYELRWKNLRSS